MSKFHPNIILYCFLRLISQFEGQMQSYRKQIEQTEQHLQVIPCTTLYVPLCFSFLFQVLGSGSAVTSEDIVAAVQKLHAAFTDLAAKYQGLHQALAAQKASYRQLHRSLHGTAPVFETKEGPRKPAQATPLPSLSGPSPFSAPTDPLVQARNSLLSRLDNGKVFLCFLVFAEAKLVHLLCLLAQQHLPPLLGALAPHLEHQPLHLLLELVTPPLEQEGVSSTLQTLPLALEIHRLVVLDLTQLLGEVLEPPHLSELPAQLLETRGTNIEYNQKSILALCQLSMHIELLSQNCL